MLFARHVPGVDYQTCFSEEPGPQCTGLAQARAEKLLDFACVYGAGVLVHAGKTWPRAPALAGLAEEAAANGIEQVHYVRLRHVTSQAFGCEPPADPSARGQPISLLVIIYYTKTMQLMLFDLFLLVLVLLCRWPPRRT